MSRAGRTGRRSLPRDDTGSSRNHQSPNAEGYDMYIGIGTVVIIVIIVVIVLALRR